MEKSLSQLLKNLKPSLNKGEYVFALANNLTEFNLEEVIGTFQESEGTTLILEKSKAEKYGLSYDAVFAWITLTVQSSLEAVGLTAAFSNELTKHNISCNVVAGFHHDHLFVLKKDKERALEVLENLSKSS